MEWICRISREQADWILDETNRSQTLGPLVFVGRNQANVYFGKPEEDEEQIVIEQKAAKGARIQENEQVIRCLEVDQLPVKNIQRVEKAGCVHRTHVLMNTSMIDEKWCVPALRPLIHPDDEVCVLAFSFFDDTKNLSDWNRQYKPGQGIFYRSNTDVFFKYGLKESQVHWVNYFTDSPEQMRKTIERSNILLLTGGAPDLMMKRIREKKLLKTLKHYQGLIIGYSAGAMVQLAKYLITPDEDYPDFSWQKGIGWISDFDVEVHYHGSRIQKEGIERAIKEGKRPVAAIDEKGGVIVDENKALSFFGKVDWFE